MSFSWHIERAWGIILT